MRLARDAAAWLPTDDPQTYHAIGAWLALIARTGVDPIVALREAIPRWFGTAKDLLPALSRSGTMAEGGLAPTPATVALEPLPPLRRPTLWPQRPKRLPNELFSSWLWRASLAAGAPPARFAFDALGACHADADAEVPEPVLRKLALASGQSVAHLAAGTLNASLYRAPVTRADVVQEALLRHGHLLLTREGRGRRPRVALQYCPRCLAEDSQPNFRRGWRFAIEAICVWHRCRLHDACWRCGAPVDLLAPTSTSHRPACAACGAAFAEARIRGAPDAVRPQRGLLCLLYYAATSLETAALDHLLDVLASHFPPGRRVAERERSLAGLLPGNLDRLLASAADPRHRDLLRRHAQGGAYGAWFGSAATQRAGHAVDVPLLGRTRPLSRQKIPRRPWFASSARPMQPALREDDDGHHWPAA